jgi:hypothetical protein
MRALISQSIMETRRGPVDSRVKVTLALWLNATK